MSKLKAVKPEILKPGKPKFLLSGPFGCGKTHLATGFPRPYYFDHEGSATREQYRKRLAAQGGVYFGKEQGSQDYKTVIEEVKTLATEKHDFFTAVFDSTSMLENMEAAIAEEKLGNDFGRDKKEAYKCTRQLLRWVEKLDMSVIFIAHQKYKWGGVGNNRSIVGTTYDGYEKLEGILDLWMEMEISGTGENCKRNLVVRKSRIESMPLGTIVNANYLDLATIYGGKEIIERAAEPVKVATEDRLKEVDRIIKKYNISQEAIEKWLSKVGVDSFDEAPQESVDKFICYYSGKE